MLILPYKNSTVLLFKAAWANSTICCAEQFYLPRTSIWLIHQANSFFHKKMPGISFIYMHGWMGHWECIAFSPVSGDRGEAENKLFLFYNQLFFLLSSASLQPRWRSQIRGNWRELSVCNYSCNHRSSPLSVGCRLARVTLEEWIKSTGCPRRL